MSEKQFEFEYNALEEMLIVNYQEGFSYNMCDEGDVYSVAVKLNEQQDTISQLGEENEQLKEENRELRKTINEVIELLAEEVDLFSDKATEHDIIAYKEMNEFDNKDAYYMCISTKKAIKMLQRWLNE